MWPPPRGSKPLPLARGSSCPTTESGGPGKTAAGPTSLQRCILPGRQASTTAAVHAHPPHLRQPVTRMLPRQPRPCTRAQTRPSPAPPAPCGAGTRLVPRTLGPPGAGPTSQPPQQVCGAKAACGLQARPPCSRSPRAPEPATEVPQPLVLHDPIYPLRAKALRASQRSSGA